MTSIQEEADKCKRSIKVLGRGQHGITVLPKQGLRGHLAFAILHSSKTALIAGVEKGTGVAIKVLGTDDKGQAILSAPVFLLTSKFSLGASFGHTNIHSVILVDRPEDLQLFTVADATVGKELELGTFPRTARDTTEARGTGIHEATNNPLLSGPKVISVEENSMMLVDIALTGGIIGPNKDLNKQAYGDLSAADILAGKAPVPEAFEPLYQVLKRDFVDEQGVLGAPIEPTTKAPEAAAAPTDAAAEADQMAA